MIEEGYIIAGSLWITFVMVAFSIAAQIYTLWLNWKQSKVKDGLEETNDLLREIRDRL